MAGVSKQIRLEKYATTQGGSGDNAETVTKYNMWAEVKRQGGARINHAGQTLLTQGIQFRVRFRPDFKPSGNWRVVFDGNRYTVQSIEKEKEDTGTSQNLLVTRGLLLLFGGVKMVEPTESALTLNPENMAFVRDLCVKEGKTLNDMVNEIVEQGRQV